MSLRPPVEGRRVVGLFGLLGSGNIGNDASMEAVLKYLRTRHPSAVVDVMCSGPERVSEQYGIAAEQMFCFDRHATRLSGRVASVAETTEPHPRRIPHRGLGAAARYRHRPWRWRPRSQPSRCGRGIRRTDSSCSAHRADSFEPGSPS